MLSSGEVIEFDTPYNLLKKCDSHFYSMVKKTGPVESEKLKEIAVIKEKEKCDSIEHESATKNYVIRELYC